MKHAWMLALGLIAACGSSDQSTGEPVPEGTCLQVAVVVGKDYRVDGQLTPGDQVGPALAGALEAGDRSSIVDVTCSAGTTMGSVRVLHDIMLEQGLRRIQYFRDPEPPIPLVLPDEEMIARLAELAAEDRCTVTIAASGETTIDGATFAEGAVRKALGDNPGVIFIVTATDEVMYADFARILGELTGAGAQRISVQLPAS